MEKQEGNLEFVGSTADKQDTYILESFQELTLKLGIQTRLTLTIDQTWILTFFIHSGKILDPWLILALNDHFYDCLSNHCGYNWDQP